MITTHLDRVFTFVQFDYNLYKELGYKVRLLNILIIGGAQLKEYIEERAIELANYIIKHKKHCKETAKKFGISKSTVHKDVTERLLKINPILAKKQKLYYRK